MCVYILRHRKLFSVKPFENEIRFMKKKTILGFNNNNILGFILILIILFCNFILLNTFTIFVILET